MKKRRKNKAIQNKPIQNIAIRNEAVKESPKKLKRYGAFLAFNLLLAVTVMILLHVKPCDNFREYLLEYREVFSSEEASVHGDRTWSQSFICPEGADSIGLFVAPVKIDGQHLYEITIYDEDGNCVLSRDVYSFEKSREWEKDDQWIFLEADKDKMLPGHEYIVDISAPDSGLDNALQIRGFKVCRTITNYYEAIAILILFISANLWWINSAKPVEKWAPWVLIGIGVIMLLIMSPSSQSNENSHYNATLKLSNLMMGKEILNETEAEYEVKLKQHFNYNTTFVELGNNFWSNEEIDSSEGYINGYAFSIEQSASYFAPAIGMTIGRLLGCNYLQTYTLARIFNFTAFVIMISIAINLIPYNKELILLIALMPMTMQQATGLSYDNVVNGMSLIFFAYMLRLIYEEKAVTWKNMLICVFLLGIFGPVKVVYSIFALLIFLIPSKQFKGISDRILKCFFVILFTALILLLTRFNDIFVRIDGSGFGEVKHYYDMRFVLGHPDRFIRLIKDTLRIYFWSYAEEAVGSLLANRSVYITLWWIRLYMLVLLIHAIIQKEKPIVGIKQRIVLFGTCVALFFSVMFTMFLTYTYSDSAEIMGVQGRYYIPLAAPFLYCLSTDKIPLKIDKRYFTALIWFVYLGVIFDVMSQIVY